MPDEFELSRRRALAALGTVGITSAGAGLGTSAFFSDQETFENNRLVAGTLDAGVGYTAHYSDWSDDEEGLTGEIRMFDGGPAEVGSADDLRDGEVGLPANDAWLIAVDEADVDSFLDDTLTDAYPNAGTEDDPEQGVVGCVDGEATPQADGATRPVIELTDVKPGDFGEVTFDFVLCDNPGYLWVNGTLRSVGENGTTEPEADDPDEEAGVVELLDVVQAAVWIDDGGDGPGGNEDGNDYQNGGEELLDIGSLREVLDLGSGSAGTALNGDIPARQGGGTGRNCFSAETTHSLAFAWWVPVDHGNEIQTDSATFDLGLYAEQCRHNDGSGMESDPVDHELLELIPDSPSGFQNPISVGFPSGSSLLEIPSVPGGYAFKWWVSRERVLTALIIDWGTTESATEFYDTFGAESGDDGHFAVPEAQAIDLGDRAKLGTEEAVRREGLVSHQLLFQVGRFDGLVLATNFAPQALVTAQQVIDLGRAVADAVTSGANPPSAITDDEASLRSITGGANWQTQGVTADQDVEFLQLPDGTKDATLRTVNDDDAGTVTFRVEVFNEGTCGDTTCPITIPGFGEISVMCDLLKVQVWFEELTLNDDASDGDGFLKGSGDVLFAAETDLFFECDGTTQELVPFVAEEEVDDISSGGTLKPNMKIAEQTGCVCPDGRLVIEPEVAIRDNDAGGLLDFLKVLAELVKLRLDDVNKVEQIDNALEEIEEFKNAYIQRIDIGDNIQPGDVIDTFEDQVVGDRIGEAETRFVRDGDSEDETEVK